MLPLFTALVGGVNIISAITPGLRNRWEWLADLYPFEVRAGGHIFAALTGFFLLTLATRLLRRKTWAWRLAVGLLMVSIVSHLLKGLDYEEALLSGTLLLQLILLRSHFTAQSDPPSIRQGIRVLGGALIFTLAYGTLGFLWLDQHYAVKFNLLEAFRQTLAMFFTADNAGLQATNRYGQFFANSIYLMGAVSLGYAFWMILRPVLLSQTESEANRQRATAIVNQYGCTSLARFTLFPDKYYFFSPSGQSIIAYVPKGRTALALGDPIGPPAERQEVLQSFQIFCHRNDWLPAFYQVLPQDLKLYQSMGWQSLKIGEEGIVDLQRFTLQGKAGRKLRSSLNKLTQAGYRLQFYQPPISGTLLDQLESISDEWLAMMQGAEKQFSLGWFDRTYLSESEIAVVLAPDGTPQAFANVIPEYQNNEATIDLMRRRQVVEHGIMDFLFIALFEHFQAQGYDGFNLGLSALSGVGQSSTSRRLERVLHFLYEHLNQFYNFQGLHAYKDKFDPRWEPRYLVYPSLTTLPEVVLALVRADSGDRLWDYFNPGLLRQLGLPWQRLSQWTSGLLGLSLFGLAVWAIAQEVQKYSWSALLQALGSIPSPWILLALGLTGANYAVLAGYDILALRYIKVPLAWQKSAQAALVSYAVSNSVGFALLSGSALRYRMYTAWGLTLPQISRIIAFCNFSFWLGLFAIGGVMFLFDPIALPKFLKLPFETVLPLGLCFTLVTAAYLGLSWFRRRPLRLRSWVLPHIPPQISILQIGLTSLDWILAAGVLFILLPKSIPLSFFGFFGIYLLAQVVGVISNVPGGLGVFESMILLLLSPPVPSLQLLGALLAYRCIYYLVPLLSAIFLLGIHEIIQYRQRRFPAP